MLETLNIKVVSYCEIPDEITERHHISEYMCGCYVPYTITSKEEQKKFDDDFELENWIINEYPELEGQNILIDIDY